MADKQKLNDQAPEDVRKRRHKKATNYRELYLLPRFVIEDGEKRKLEAGEYDAKSQLYPISTPIKEMSDFGIGIGMYFTTTMWFGVMMLICGIFNAPTAAYFSSSQYDKDGAYDASFKSGASASCVTEQRVCLNAGCTRYAGEFHFPSMDEPRYKGGYTPETQEWRDKDFEFFDDDANSPNVKALFGTEIGTYQKKVVEAQDKMTVGLRKCKLKRWFGVTDFCMMIFVSCTLLYLGYQQNKEAEELDEAEQTAQDYSVIIEDPNPECVDPDEWKAFFEERFGPVFMVCVCLDNGELVKLFKQKRFIENEMMLEAIEAERYAKAKRASQMNQSAKSYFKQFMELVGLDPTLESYTMQLLKTNMAISKHKHKTYKACKVFVVFNEESHQRLCLNSMCVGKIPAMQDRKDLIDEKFLFKGNLLSIKEAPEPSTVLYENLHYGIVDYVKEQVVSWAVLGVGLICTYFTVDVCFAGGQPVLGAILISFWNGVLPEINRALVMILENHHTVDDMEDSFILKTVAARWFTSSLILYLVGLDHSTQILGPYYIGSIQAVLLADAITNPIVRLMDMSGVMKRNILAPMAGTDDRAKALNIGTDYLLAERYTDLAKTVLMSLFYSAIFPLGYFYSAFACFLCFWVDKYCVLRLFRPKPPAGDKLVRITRTFTAIVVLIHCVITSHFYYSWPFDNLCPTKQTLDASGLSIAAAIGANTDIVYTQCLSVSDQLLPPVKEEKWFQTVDGSIKDGAQYRLVGFYNVVSIIMLCYICVAYFGSDAGLSIYSLFYYKHTEVGEAKEIPYDTVVTGEGYVPQFEVDGKDHAVMCVVAPVPKAPNALGGGLEFDTYLLNWTAARARDAGDDEASFTDYTDEEKDSVYRADNVYFDDQLVELDKAHLDKDLLSRTKQYIRNAETQEAGAIRMSVAGRARASTMKKNAHNEAGGGGGSMAMRMSDSAKFMASSVMAQAKVVKVVGNPVGSSPNGNLVDAQIAKPAGENELASMAATAGTSA